MKKPQSKICESCKEKNNPAFIKCWKCDHSFSSEAKIQKYIPVKAWNSSEENFDYSDENADYNSEDDDFNDEDTDYSDQSDNSGSFVQLIVGAAIVWFLFSQGCFGDDKDYVPFNLKGMDAWVYNNENDKEFYGGRAEGNYFQKEDVLSQCGSLAYATAKANHIEDWSYVCCTVTSKSDCMTKVR